MAPQKDEGAFLDGFSYSRKEAQDSSRGSQKRAGRLVQALQNWGLGEQEASSSSAQVQKGLGIVQACRSQLVKGEKKKNTVRHNSSQTQ